MFSAELCDIEMHTVVWWSLHMKTCCAMLSCCWNVSIMCMLTLVLLMLL